VRIAIGPIHCDGGHRKEVFVNPYPPRTPQEVQEFISQYGVFKEDTDDFNFFPQEEIKRRQGELLKRQVQWAYEGSPYYREIFDQRRLSPADLKSTDDLVKLPVTAKKTYMGRPEDFRLKFTTPSPYDQFYDVTYTTGTTMGKPTPFYNTSYDHFLLTRALMRYMKIACVTPDDIIVNTFPLGVVPHIGYVRMNQIAFSIGARLVVGNTGSPFPEASVHRTMQELIEMIERFKVTAVGGIGSFCRRLIVEAERKGKDFSSVRNVLAMGEGVPRGMREDMRERLQKMGARNVFISNPFGFTEAQASFAECAEFSGCHNYDPSLYFMEVVNPETGERLADGETGHLAITHLNRRGTVLVRYLIGDISAITNETCPYCGRCGQRLIIKAGSTYGTRTKELVKLKGTLINPETMKSEISNVLGVAEYQIIFTKEDLQDPYSLDKLLIKVAVSDRSPEEVAREIRERILITAEMTPKVEFAKPEEIYDPAKSLKATRVIDLRPGE